MKTIQSFWKMAVVIAAVFASSCSSDEEIITSDTNAAATDEMMREGGNNPDEAILQDIPSISNYRGFVYVAGNEKGTGRIYIYKHDQNGNLTYQGGVASGGTGNGMSLDSQGALTISADRTHLFAVNAGSNSISSFKIDGEGNLWPLHTTPSGGMTPVSVTVYQDRLYVVHAGGTINGFSISTDGKLLPIPNSERKLSIEGAGPAQISFAPGGRYLYVTERKTNRITVFQVDNTGAAGEGVVTASVGETPFGFDFARGNYMIVSNAGMGLPNGSSVTSYLGIENGLIANVNGAVSNGQTASCWVATTKHGRYAYVTNTGSGTISSYYIDANGKLLLANAQIGTGDSPSDIVVSSNNYNVFVLCAADGSIQQYVRTPLGNLKHVGQFKGIPQSASGLAVW